MLKTGAIQDQTYTAIVYQFVNLCIRLYMCVRMYTCVHTSVCMYNLVALNYIKYVIMYYLKSFLCLMIKIIVITLSVNKVNSLLPVAKLK